jgi:hypothetical protein
MDKEFFRQRLLVISQYQKNKIVRPKEQEYYMAYVNKLYTIMLSQPSANDLNDRDIDYFERKEGFLIKNRLFCNAKNMLHLAYRDVNDVVNSMKRWDGVQDLFDVEKFYGFKDEE